MSAYSRPAAHPEGGVSLGPPAILFAAAAARNLQLRHHNGGRHWQLCSDATLIADYWPTTHRLLVHGDNPQKFEDVDHHQFVDLAVYTYKPVPPPQTQAAAPARDQSLVDDLVVALATGDAGWRHRPDEIVRRANEIAAAREAVRR